MLGFLLIRHVILAALTKNNIMQWLHYLNTYAAWPYLKTPVPPALSSPPATSLA